MLGDAVYCTVRTLDLMECVNKGDREVWVRFIYLIYDDDDDDVCRAFVFPE